MSEQVARPYIILPFNFMRLGNNKLLLVNFGGEYLFVSDDDFKKLISYDLNRKFDPLFSNLKAKHLIAEKMTDPAIDLLAVKYRTKKDFLSHFTSLHMIEITRRCNQKCIYCQASSQEPRRDDYDMDMHTAKKTVDMILMTSSKSIKIEFQGGEPLLNYGTVKYIIEYATEHATLKGKEVQFVVCTNLTLATDEMFQYFSDNNVLISTSLDGPERVHDFARRYRDGRDTYEDVIRSLDKAKKYIEPSKISALITTTQYSLDHPNEILDEYVSTGFRSMFVRPLNPFGYAKEKMERIGYTPSEFIDFYKRLLEYALQVNLKGYFVEEAFASLVLTRILTPFSTGFVDLQFPAGTGISGVMYGYNGNVYLSDEARMLANMGNLKFCLGNIHNNSYEELFNNVLIRNTIRDSCAESSPGCAECAFQMYCGIDPVRNYATQDDTIGHRPTNDFCLINKEILKCLFEIIEHNNPGQMDVFWSWITRRNLSEIRMEPEC